MVDDPANYGWSSCRRHAFGEPDAHLTPHPLHQSLGMDDAERQAAYRALVESSLDGVVINDIRLAATQSQPLGNTHFHEAIAQMTGIRREPRPRVRPRKGATP